MVRWIYRKRPPDQCSEFCDLCYRGSQKTPRYVLNFISLKFKENVNVSLLQLGFYLSLAQQSGWSRNQCERCPGPPSTPPLPDVYIPFRFNFCFADAGKLLAGLKEIYSCLHVQICELVASHYFMTRTW